MRPLQANPAELHALQPRTFGTCVAILSASARSEAPRNGMRPVSNQGNSGLFTPRGLKITGTAFSNEPTFSFFPSLSFRVRCDFRLLSAACTCCQAEATGLAFRDSNWVDFYTEQTSANQDLRR